MGNGCPTTTELFSPGEEREVMQTRSILEKTRKSPWKRVILAVTLILMIGILVFWPAPDGDARTAPVQRQAQTKTGKSCPINDPCQTTKANWGRRASCGTASVAATWATRTGKGCRCTSARWRRRG